MRAVSLVMLMGLTACGSSWQPALDDDWDALFPISVQHWKDCDDDGWGDPMSEVFCADASENDATGDGCALVENDYDCDDTQGDILGTASGADLFGQGCPNDYGAAAVSVFGVEESSVGDHVTLSSGRTEYLYFNAPLDEFGATAVCDGWGREGGAVRSHPVAGLARGESAPEIQSSGFLPDSPAGVLGLVEDDPIVWLSATFDDNDVLRWRESAVVRVCDTDPDGDPNTNPPADCVGDELIVGTDGFGYEVADTPAVSLGYCGPLDLAGRGFAYCLDDGEGTPVVFDYGDTRGPREGLSDNTLEFQERTPTLADFDPIPQSFVDGNGKLPDGYDSAGFRSDMLIPVLLREGDASCIVHPATFCAPLLDPNADPATSGWFLPSPFCREELEARATQVYCDDANLQPGEECIVRPECPDAVDRPELNDFAFPVVCQRDWVEPEARIHATRRLDECDGNAPD